MGGKSLYLDCLEMQSVLALQLNLGVSNDCVIVFLYTYQCLAFYNLFILSILNLSLIHI
mgnify:FL=1